MPAESPSCLEYVITHRSKSNENKSITLAHLYGAVLVIMRFAFKNVWWPAPPSCVWLESGYPVYTIQPVSQQVVSCKRGWTMHVIGEFVTYMRNYLHTKEPKEMELLVNTHS